MRNFSKTLFILNLLAAACYGEPSYHYAITRDIADSFEDGLKLNPPLEPIDLALAKQQHEDYIHSLQRLVGQVIRLRADPKHPDCNFIEDTAIIVNNIAIISNMGAEERRGEEIPLINVLKQLGLKTIRLQAPATMDGGDILYTGKHLFVGLSKRTNKHALNQLKDIFRKTGVIGIPVTEGLHLKSVISLFDESTLIVAANPAGATIQAHIEATTDDYTFITVPDPIAANVLRVGSTLLIQEGFPESEAILQNLCNQTSVTLIKLNMSELIKADGALTCGSLLIK